MLGLGTAATLALPMALVPTAARGAPTATASGVVYTMTNELGGNRVLAFRRSADGTLTSAGSYATGGTGTGLRRLQTLGPVDVDQSLIISPDHRRLFTVNEGSNSISVFTINSDGSLRLVKGAPFASGGANPASLGLTGDKLYIINKDDYSTALGGGFFGGLNAPVDAQRPNITGFRVAGNGHLTPIPHSTVQSPPGSSPTQALIAPNGRTLFTSEFFGQPGQADGSLLRALAIRPNGRLVDTAGSPQSTQANPIELPAGGLPGFLAATFGNIVVGLQAHPTKPYVYVGQPLNSLTGTPTGGQQQLGVYRYDEAGSLTYQRSVFASGFALCWFVINPQGTRMYATSTLDGGVSVFDIAGANAAAPKELFHLRLPGHSGAPFDGPAPGQLALAGGYLYITSNGSSTGSAVDRQLDVVKVTGDTLTHVTTYETPAYDLAGVAAI